MKRFYVPWLHFLVRPSRVDFAEMAVRARLRELDGSRRAAVRMLTGCSDAELDDLGGL